MEKPYFSVVMPLYNKEPHIARSISSVLNQTFDDFELIIVNDASTDRSVGEVKKFVDRRVRILNRNKPGPGGYAARNLGIKEAKAEWVAFLDADDEWFVDHLENMYQLAKQFNDVYFMGCGWKDYNGAVYNNNRYYIKNHIKGNHIIDVKTYLRNSLNDARPINTDIACIKLKSPLAYNLFPAESGARRGGDLHAWHKMICYHRKMAWSAHIGAIYYRDSVNMVTKHAPFSPILVSKEVYSHLSEGLDYEERKLIKSIFNKSLFSSWLGNKKRGNQNFRLINRM